MPKITAKFERDHPQRECQTQMALVKIGHFRRITHFNSKTVQDSHAVSAQFLLKLNRKLYVLYRMVMLPMTLGDH